MLARTEYHKNYIESCSAQMNALLGKYKEVAKAAGKAGSEFEPLFFNNLVLVLEGYFVHRLRAQEGKDGNPLNEVRMLASSILEGHGVLLADKTIKYRPEASVLKLAIGDRIALDEAAFKKLSKAYFVELERKFG